MDMCLFISETTRTILTASFYCGMTSGGAYWNQFLVQVHVT